MGFHHVAFACADLDATHRFYTDAMGFELVKAVEAPTPEGGWARHVFYDTGGDGMIAFWDLHVDALQPVRTAISADLGLPDWVNHLAFDAPDETSLLAARDRWLALGIDVFEVDHGFCRSMYATDPNGILVEWCMDCRPLTPEEREHANAVVAAPDHGEFEAPPGAAFHPGDPALRPEWALRRQPSSA